MTPEKERVHLFIRLITRQHSYASELTFVVAQMSLCNGMAPNQPFSHFAIKIQHSDDAELTTRTTGPTYTTKKRSCI